MPGDPCGGAGDGEGLGELSGDEEGFEAVDIDAGDADAPVCFGGDEPLGFENSQGLPDRGDGGVEPFSDLILSQPFAAIEFAGEDLATQAVDDHVSFRRYRLQIHLTAFRSYADESSLQGISHCVIR